PYVLLARNTWIRRPIDAADPDILRDLRWCSVYTTVCRRIGDASEMNGDSDFVRALSEFLAFHTEQPTAYFNGLITSFMRGAQGRPNLESSAKDKLAKRLKLELETYRDVPTFLQNYLLTHSAHGAWPPQAAFVATRYLARPTDERFMSWQRRQQLTAEL